MTEERTVTRREFLKASGGAGLGGAALTGVTLLTTPARVLGSNGRAGIAICGLHGRGMDHVAAYSKIPQARIVALCDVDDNVMRRALTHFEKAGLPKPETYVDARKLMENRSVDAVSIATPNHWHSLLAIWACQAGKDAYVEKPCCHNLWEGQQLIHAAQRYQRVVQHGTQIRSATAIREGIQKLHQGTLGDVYMARGLCFKWRDTIGHAPVQPVPAGVDYNLWTGPAPSHPFTRNRFHYNWHWFWDYGNGDLGNQGVHQLDVARWGLGVGYPNKISAIGGHFMFDDDQQTPNTLNCAFEFDHPNGQRQMLEFEVRHWITNHEASIGTPMMGTPAPKLPPGGSPRLGPMAGTHNTVGNIFYGSKGYLATGDEDADTYKIWLGADQQAEPSVHGGAEVAHFQNFVDCVLSRKVENLNAPIQEGVISASLVHLANASYRLGRTLHFDPHTLKVSGDDEANELLHGTYRPPFVVPEVV